MALICGVRKSFVWAENGSLKADLEAGENPTMPGVSPALQNEIDPPCDAAWMGLGTEDNEDEDAPHIYSGPSAIDQPRLLVDILQLLEVRLFVIL